MKKAQRTCPKCGAKLNAKDIIRCWKCHRDFRLKKRVNAALEAK